MILIFFFAAALTCVVVLAFFVSQSDACVTRLSRRQCTYLYSLIVGLLCIPLVLVISCNLAFGVLNPRLVPFRYGIVLLQFVLLAGVYARYGLKGVLALHFSGVMMLVVFAFIAILHDVAVFDKMPNMPALSDEGWQYFGLAAVSGSLMSVVYSVVYIAVHRKRRVSAGQATDCPAPSQPHNEQERH